MAIFHLSCNIVSRSKGQSVIAAAAYRSGTRLKDRRRDITFNYSRKKGVEERIIIAPENSPKWVYNREELWNRVEEKEKRADAQLAREFNIAIPVELNRKQHYSLILDYVKETFVDEGMIADVCFHDIDSHNPHFHVLLTTREITPEGFGKKVRDWNKKELLVRWRKTWADRVNAELERAGIEARVDHRSFEERGITDRLPQIHLGPLHKVRERFLEAGQLDEFRELYGKGDLYEMIEETNRQFKTLREERAAVEAELEKIIEEEAGARFESATEGDRLILNTAWEWIGLRGGEGFEEERWRLEYEAEPKKSLRIFHDGKNIFTIRDKKIYADYTPAELQWFQELQRSILDYKKEIRKTSRKRDDRYL